MRPEKISVIFQNFQIYPIFCFLEGCVTVYERVAQQHRPTEIKKNQNCKSLLAELAAFVCSEIKIEMALIQKLSN